jgi:hypothetical protein
MARTVRRHGAGDARGAAWEGVVTLVAVCLAACDFAPRVGPDVADAASAAPGADSEADPRPVGPPSAADAGADPVASDGGGSSGSTETADEATAEGWLGACGPDHGPVATMAGTGDDGAPALASSGAEVGVAWVRTGADPGLWFARLAADGSVRLWPEAVAAGPVDPGQAPALAWTGSDFVAAWSAAGAVWALPIGGAPVRLSDEGVEAAAPDLARDASGLAAVWQERGPDGERVRFARLGPDARPLGAVTVAAGAARQPRLAAGGPGFALAWLVPGDHVQAVRLALLDPDGAPVGDPMDLGLGGYAGGPALVADDRGFTLAWHEFLDGDSEVYLRRVGADGAIEPAVRITRGAVRPVSPALVALGRGFALAWQDERTGERQVYAVRLAADGKALGAETALTCAGEASIQPALAPVGDGLAAAWSATEDGDRQVRVGFGGVAAGAGQR